MVDQPKQWEDAYAALHAMAALHCGKPYPTSFAYPEEVREAAQIMSNEIKRLRGAMVVIGTKNVEAKAVAIHALNGSTAWMKYG